MRSLRPSPSVLITVALCVGVWLGLDAMSDLVGRRIADIASLLVFATAGGAFVWRLARGR